jgi:Carboxypeptidase regulatory-like domain
MRTVVSTALFALLTLANLGYGQTIDANLVGTVVDVSGAAVPNATISITNASTGIVSNTKTNADGQYRFNNIPIGLYNLSATAAGFAPANLKNIEIQLSKTSTANVTLQVGTVSTTVDVAEVGVVIDTTTAQVQSNFDSRQIVNMPIIENSNSLFGALNLSLLSAGVASNGGIGQGTGPSVGGQRPMNNNFMIEGVDNNNKTITGPLVYVPTEATAEFTLLQNQVGAEFGHSSGGQFNTVIKSGTNQTHGSLYEYFQNRKLNALDSSFTNAGIYSKPRYDQNRLGGSIGGALIKDKLFYFANVEYAPYGAGVTASTPVSAPTAAGYALLDKMTNISKTNYSILKQYVPAAPVANDATTVNGVSIPIGILPISGSNYTNFWTFLGSVDYNRSSNDQIRARFINNRQDALDNNANLPAFWTTLPQRYYLISVADYHTFSPTITNEVRLAFNRFSQFYTVPGNLSFPGLDTFPNLQIDTDLGLQIGPDPNAPQFTVQNTYQLVENLNWTKGRHTFKFGFDGRNVISPQHFIQRERGDYNWSTLETYLNDTVPDDFAERNLGSTGYYGNQWATYLYANDNWRVKNNLTLDLGVRWERTSVPLGQGLQALNTLADVPGLISFHGPRPQNKNFAPKLGIAYSPGKSGRTSIRAGFGMSYDVIFDNVGSTAYPPQLSSTYDAGDYPNIFKAPFLANGGIFPGSLPGGSTLGVAAARAATSSYLPDQVLPYSIQWNAGVQHVFHNDYTLEVRYLGTRGVHLLTQNRLNRQNKVDSTYFLPTYLTAPSQAQLDSLSMTLAQIQARSSYVPAYANAGFNAASIVGFMPWSDSTYHGLATQLTRRFSHGLQSVVSYTFSHNIDDATATHFSTLLSPRRPEDFRNLSAERSNSPLDRRHRVTVNWLWDMPYLSSNKSWAVRNMIGNWRFVGTYTAESGEWVTAQSNTDANLNGDAAGDRTILNAAGDPKLGSGVTALKNSSGATVAYLATNPNAMYIAAGAGARTTAGRNTILMPGINNFDLSLAKKFSFGETRRLEIRGDFTNAFNHPQYTAGLINSVKLTSQTTSNIFLQPANKAFQNWSQNFSSNSRTIQLVAKIVF